MKLSASGLAALVALLSVASAKPIEEKGYLGYRSAWRNLFQNMALSSQPMQERRPESDHIPRINKNGEVEYLSPFHRDYVDPADAANPLNYGSAMEKRELTESQLKAKKYCDDRRALGYDVESMWNGCKDYPAGEVL